jgi:MFS family permease
MNCHDDDLSAARSAEEHAGAMTQVDIQVQPCASKSSAGIDDPPEVGARWIALLILAYFGVNVAFVTPIAISLAIRVKDLAPSHENYLGLIIGVGALAALLTGPLGGQLSDRTRSGLGRRRPWLIGGMGLGLIALAIMAVAPAVWVLAVGWVLAQIGFSQVLNNLTTIQADRLPEAQRGKVAGLAGSVSMAAPVIGAMAAVVLAEQPVLLFMVPGAIALILVTLFVLRIPEDDSRDLVFDTALTAKTVISKYVFDPRRYPDYSWNWLGRFLFFFGLTLGTTYTAFFLASRLGMKVTEVGTIVAITGIVGIVATTVGALGSGIVSDRISQRKPFVLAGAVSFGLGAAVMSMASGLPQIIIGSALCNIGIGVFTATDQALLLDVLPERDTEAGRFISIAWLATAIPQAVAPIVASVMLSIGVGSPADRNYALVYAVAAVFAVCGGLAVLRVKSVR